MSRHERHLQQVIVVPYDPQWPHLYEQAAQELASALGSNLIEIYHIGSTAIPEIHAKPIIDLLPVVRELAVVDDCLALIQQLGYEVLGEFGIAGRRYFRRFNAAGERTHHVHVFQHNSPEIARHLAFRDFLRAHPQLAQQYGAVKVRVAAAHPDNWQAYCDGKAELVEELERQALIWHRQRG